MSATRDEPERNAAEALNPVAPTRLDDKTEPDVTDKDGNAPIIAPNSHKAELIDQAVPDPFGHDLGWNKDVQDMPSPIVRGLANDDLFMLIRRFNGQTYHVRRSTKLDDKRLDFETVADEEFSPDKLRSHFERFYIQIIVNLMAFVKHVARIQSWKETRRTACFCAAYFGAWLLNILMPALLFMLLTLIVYPPARPFLFPPAPLAAVNHKTGTLQTPAAGSLGSSDSLTGAPEAHKGQAVEREASNFVTGLGTMAVATVAGKSGDRDSVEADHKSDAQLDESQKEEDPSDPVKAAEALSAGRAAATGDAAADVKDDKTRVTQQVIWEKARPFMQGLEEAIDTWECIANALSPKPPFSSTLPRLKLAGCVAPVLLMSIVVPSRYYVKSLEVIVGLALFTQPLALKAVHWLNQNYPNWPQAIELRNTLLLGVPTNAQLTVTLLRLGEEKNAPLPPPPDTVNDLQPPSPPAAPKITGDVAVDAHPDEVAAQTEEPGESETESEKASGTSSLKPKKRSKLLGALKGLARGTVTTAVGVDRVKATAGGQNAQRRQGALGGKHARVEDGPVAYAARHHGSKGSLVLSLNATTPCVAFESRRDVEHQAPDPKFTIALDDIQEIKKRGGLGWKSKLVVGTALGMEITDGITIVLKDGKQHTFTALPRRDEFFNRLIAVISAKWECL